MMYSTASYKLLVGVFGGPESNYIYWAYLPDVYKAVLLQTSNIKLCLKATLTLITAAD